VISHGPDEAETENGVFVGCVLSYCHVLGIFEIFHVL
jgi:hypothetical protein